MVKVLFAGPSFAGIDLAGATPQLGDIALRPPAAHGDLTRAVLEGATAIGLVDGLFEAVAAVWHKEILYALSHGVRVLGAASMGALRAAECAALGMEAVGPIAHSYLDGSRDDDADVGLLHAPAEFGYLPLTEPMVDVEATLARLVGLGLIAPDEHARILTHARAIFFCDRTVDLIVPPALAQRRDAILDAYETHRVAQKQADALALVERLRALPDRRDFQPGFALAESPMWRRRLAALTAESHVTAA